MLQPLTPPSLQQQSAPQPQPVIFLGHGSPMNALAQNQFTQHWQQQLADLTGVRKPKAILLISAHWYGEGVKITAQTKPPTLHDFSGFPPELFAVNYPAPGAPELAAHIQAMLAPLVVQLDHNWGFDHGAWSVLVHAVADADIPLLQLSLDSRESPDWHLALGQKLKALRQQGVLIIGSGNIVHNLRLLDWSNQQQPAWATDFVSKVKTAIAQRDFAALCDYRRLSKDALLAVPHPDHYLPLLYVLGASSAEEPLQFFNDELVYGSLSMLSLRYGA
ncbi:4,5-DOPA dioxygenase extradiol [Rheinheimera sp.]|uniref:4,5-DOPA-extradiol-dioxygenase n=1 Tax=Rheinheimera sp. TaxID=1869214 RepID=UPI0027BA2BEF|nr:4,5-DOPA dioxygenase extradiol [Rheinheimera sp.]